MATQHLLQKVIDVEEFLSQFTMNKFCEDLNDFIIKKPRIVIFVKLVILIIR